MEERKEAGQEQVWQRVFARQEAPAGDGLRELQLAAMELAGAYRALSGKLTGRAREKVQRLYEGEQAGLAALKGVAVLSGRGGEVLKPWNSFREPPEKLLEKCYHKTRRSMVEYAARSAEAEFGIVFQSLAQRAGLHCAMIAELLGMM